MDEHDPVEGDGGNVSQCRECGTVVEDDMNFCPDCGSALEDALAAYCRVCGSAFESEDRFCSDCGAVRDPGIGEADASGNSRRSAPEESWGSGPKGADDTEAAMAAFRKRVQSYLADGWVMEHDYGDSVVLVDRDFGSVPVHVALFFFTGGIGNCLYGFHRYKNRADRLRLTAGEDADARAPSGSTHGPGATDSGGSDSTSVTRIVFSTMLFLGGLAMVVSNPLDAFNWALGVPLLLGGAYLFPPTRHRIEDRHPVTRFGTVRSTDETVVRFPDKPCVACGRPIEVGIKRTYREEKAIAGIPVMTVQDGENHYCESCAGGAEADGHRADRTRSDRVPEYETN
jgi:predicted nucleic acid-binding Zn ribbon protein